MTDKAEQKHALVTSSSKDLGSYFTGEEARHLGWGVAADPDLLLTVARAVLP